MTAGSTTSTELKTPIRRVLRPIQQFIQTESSSGLVLLASTIIALIWVNLAPESYNGTWDTRASFRLGSAVMELSLRDWVNDGLMVIFFLLVGMEIKRELLVGELSSPRKALLPIAAALGGMVVPALCYLSLNIGTDSARGWGIPMATDIAFALGVLALLGRRVPTGVKVFLAALAIADDLGAVLVIAIFYTESLQFSALGASVLIFLVLLLSNWAGIRWLSWYGVFGLLLWLAVFNSGVHATIAGVLLAMAMPAWSRIDLPRFRQHLEETTRELKEHGDPTGTVLADEDLLSRVTNLRSACTRLQPSLHRLEHDLAPWVAMLIMPIFAMANSGVYLAQAGSGLGDPLALGIALGLLVGKPVGITLGSWLVVRFGLASLPRNTSWKHLVGVGMLGGVGFTMALFIAGLAFGEGARLDTARLAILSSSALAGFAGFLFLRRMPPVKLEE